MTVPKETDYADATWNKYRTLKNKLDHEAVKEYWEESAPVYDEAVLQEEVLDSLYDNPLRRVRSW